MTVSILAEKSRMKIKIQDEKELVLYNGPFVKTTVKKFIVNIF